METEFAVKLRRGAIRSLTKVDGTTVAVRVEGVYCRGGEEPIYDVRELVSKIGYPASERDLKLCRR